MKLTDPAIHTRLSKILSQPSSPFREKHVLEAIESVLEKEKIPHFRDPHRNLIVGAKSKADYLKLIRAKSTEPVRIFIAHMDHPGFHGTEWIEGEAGETGATLAFKWHGGSPTAH